MHYTNVNFREIFERLVKLWSGKFRLSLRIVKTRSVKLPEKVRGLVSTWGLLVLEVCRNMNHKNEQTRSGRISGLLLWQASQMYHRDQTAKTLGEFGVH